MKISVVIPAFNEEKLLPDTLSSVKGASAAFAQRGWESEIIVCDNNSTDKTSEIARAHGAKVVFEPINQISRARNTGARIATGDWLIFIDADSKPSPELFDEVAKLIESGKYLGGGCVVDLENVPPKAKFVGNFWNIISRTMTWAAGSFIFCRADAFKQLNGFNQDLFVSEEIDFSKRLKKLANKLGLKLKIITSHSLLTSGRKVHLYKKREYLLFLLQTVFRFGKPLRERQSCKIWYDGRR